MGKNSSVEDALFQIKDLEKALNKNAEGILSSTMKKEISSLVKESLKEQGEVEDEEEVDVDIEDTDTDNEEDVDYEEEDTFDVDDEDMTADVTMPSDDDTIDMTGASDAEVLRVFKAMGDNDGVVVKRDDNMIHLSDNENDTEYIIQLSESMMEDPELKEFGKSEYDLYDFHHSEDDEDDFSFEDEDDDDEELMEYSDDDRIYEISLDDEELMESKKSKKFSPKGVGMGSASKYKMSKKPNMDGGFKTVKKNANKTMGTGRAKFEYKEGENMNGTMKKVEAKEASRFVKSIDRKVKRNLMAAPKQIKEEVGMLRAKNEEYKKALNIFRTKLNEVAIFNSNLAYATRLFTEHSTSKQEKINILKRFDGVETLKESKNLYRVIKNELSDNNSGNKTQINESIQRTVSSGSAVNLIESKTYENPQFLRMKDLMYKIK